MQAFGTRSARVSSGFLALFGCCLLAAACSTPATLNLYEAEGLADSHIAVVRQAGTLRQINGAPLPSPAEGFYYNEVRVPPGSYSLTMSYTVPHGAFSAPVNSYYMGPANVNYEISAELDAGHVYRLEANEFGARVIDTADGTVVASANRRRFFSP